MSGASWDSDLSSIIEKTNNNLKLLRKIGDKPQVRAPDVSVTNQPSLARSGSASGSVSSHSSARPRAFVGAQDDAGSVSSRSSARPRAFIRGDDDSSSMGSHGTARPKAFVRGDDDTGSMGSHGSARPRVYVGDDSNGSVSSHSSARPKAFIRADDDAASAVSRASARPKAFIRADDDSGSVSSRASARPKAFIRGDDDTGSMSSRSSARPKAFIRGDDDAGSMSSNQGLGRSRLDSGTSSSGRPHVGIAGGGGLTAAMLQQHRATAGNSGPGTAGLAMADLRAPRARYDLDETRSMSGTASSRLRRPLGANGRVPHARAGGLGASMGPRIRVPDSDIPSDIPNHVVDEIKKSLETHFASRNGAVDKKVADLRTDVSGLTTQTSALSSQISELRDAVLLSANNKPSGANAPSVSDPKVIASVQANAAAIARLEEHSADLLGRKVSVDRELTELGSRVKSMSSASMKISTLEDNIEALVANRHKQEQGLFKLADRVQLMHRQMGSLVDMKAVENLVSIRLTREFREMEDRLSQNVMRMAEKMEQKVQSLEKQSFSQRQESMATLKNDLTDDIQRLQSSALRKSDLLPLQNAQTQSKEDLAQLSNALERQEKKLQDAKLASSTLRDELVDARTELNKALQNQQRSAASLLEERLEQIASNNKDRSHKFDDQLAELAKKQKKLEEATKTLQETMVQVKAEAGQRLSRSSADREEENDKLRQRLARSVAELEALATTKAEVERRFTSEEQQFQARLKELRTTLSETEKQKEAQRLELMQKLQEESKLMGVAQGKNTLLENLLAREKSENEEKNELVRKSKKEVTEVREQIRNLESEKEKKVRQLTSELQAKQTQVGLLTKTLKRIETASAKMLDLSKREAKTVRRVKATKEHELFIAQLKLKEMERVAQALQNGDEMKKQAALTAASTEERNELEKLLLESQLEKDELKQELEEMTEEFNAAKESQKVIMEDTITKLSSDYDDKISELKQQIADKEQAMRQLRDTLVEKSNLDALEDELAALKDEKNDLLEQIQRAQIEHERVTLKTETNLRLEHATEFAAMKSKFEERISELESAKSEIETTKATIAELESELEKQEALHQREVSTLTHEIKEARSKIDECTAQILNLEEVKARLEGEVSQMEANIGGASAEKEEELAAIKSQMQSEVERLRAELGEVSNTLEEKQTMLKEAKQSDEANRQRLVEMAMAQEEMQSRYVSQIDSLSLKLNQERESSRVREQDLEETIDKLNADVKSLKAESGKELEAARSELTDQMTELTTTLKASQHREQQLQSRLKRILEELVQAANASGENEVAEDAAEMSDDDAITHHLDALYATHRRTAHELERLQAEYELTVKQAAADSATAQELDNQVKEHVTQIKELESVVDQLREELKEQYHKSAIIAKGSDEFSDEMATLREEKRELERQLQEEEKDRAKREVSYQRRTEMKEREVEELRTENKTLTAAVAAVREKIRAVESVKYHDLSELQNKLKDLEERTAALQPDENNVANMEKDFTATRQEITTLTSDVQSLYQKLTACCGIMEWSELRASVFDEEDKLSRVRSENAREMAKVQSVEQEVLMNAEFLNALLVAHGSTGGDDNLLNDFRWMQKYASIAPEIVEKLRKVESRLRDAVSIANGDQVVARPPKSQNSAVDGAAIATALEKAREDYFCETSEAADALDDADVNPDMDQPDVEQESVTDAEGEGASHDNVDVDGQGSSGDMSHDESGVCTDELVVAEHVVRDKQELSREDQGATTVAMSNVEEDEELSVGVAKGSFKNKQDRNDNGLVSSKIEMTKIQSRWSSMDFSGDGADEDMDEAENLMLDRSLAHSSKQVNPHIDNECDDSDEFATTTTTSVRAETEEKQSAVVSDEIDEDTVNDTAELGELGQLAGANLEASSELVGEHLDPLDECTFDNVKISALQGSEASASSERHGSLQRTAQSYEEEDQSVQGADALMVSAYENENSDFRVVNDPETQQKATVEPTTAEEDSQLEVSIDGEALPGGEVSAVMIDKRVVDQLHEGNSLEESTESVVANALEDSSSSVDNGGLAEELGEGSVPNSAQPVLESTSEVSSSSMTSSSGAYSATVDHGLEQPASRLESGALTDRFDEDNEFEESVSTGIVGNSAGEDDGLEELSASSSLGGDHESALEESARSSKSVESKQFSERSAVEPSPPYMGRGVRADEFDELEESAVNIASVVSGDGAQLDHGNAENAREESSSSGVFDQLAGESHALEESASHMANNPLRACTVHASEESVSSRKMGGVADDVDELEESILSVESDGMGNPTMEVNNRNALEESETNVENDLLDDQFDGVVLDKSVSGVDNTALDGESSFDADMQSDRDDDLGSSADAELSPHSVKRPEEDECEWSEEQLQAAETSLNEDSAVEDDNEASDSAEPTPTVQLRMEEDESSEEEEIMTVQNQPPFSTSRSRLGTGVHRLHLEEDDEMDEIERLLLDQSASSMLNQQQQSSQYGRPSAGDDDDEFGEASLQSQGGGESDFGEESIRSRQDDEFWKAPSDMLRTEEGDELPIQSQVNEVMSHESSRFTRPKASDDDEFGEGSLQSREVFGGALVKEHESEFGEESIRPNKSKEVHQHPPVRFTRFTTSLAIDDDDDAFGEPSLQSRSKNEDYESEGLVHSLEEPVLARSAVLSHQGEIGDDDEFNEDLIGSRSQERTIHFHESKVTEGHDGSRLREESQFGTSILSILREDDDFVEILGSSPTRLNSRGGDEFGETSIRSGSYEEDDDFGEISIPLQEDAGVGQTSSRSPDAAYSTRTASSTDRRAVYHEGLMNSPVKRATSTASAAHEDSTSEAEHDYMDESFDLDESLEEDEDEGNDERHV